MHRSGQSSGTVHLRDLAIQCPSNSTSVWTFTPFAFNLVAPPKSGRPMTKAAATTPPDLRIKPYTTYSRLSVSCMQSLSPLASASSINVSMRIEHE